MKLSRLIRLCVAAFLSALLSGAVAWAASAADDFELEPGYISLFNGKDLTGWGYRTIHFDVKTTYGQRLHLGKASDRTNHFDGKIKSSDGRYYARDGVLVVNPHNPETGPRIRQLWTSREFPKDFKLKLEFRAAVNADSGIFIRGPQLQCRDYAVAGPDKYKQLKKYKPQDWNQIEVTVTNGVAFCTCNGEVLEAALPVPESGPIGLEADRGQMEYRRIRFKRLL